MWSKLQGKKTYIVCAVTIVWAAIGSYMGWIDADAAQQMIFGALGMSGLRAAKQLILNYKIMSEEEKDVSVEESEVEETEESEEEVVEGAEEVAE